MALQTSGVSRRRFVAAGAGTLGVASAGCLRRIRTVAGRDQPSRLSLDIATVPADGDPHGVRIARHLAAGLDAAGVGARVTTMTEEELYRRVLLNAEFDLYVGQFPDADEVDPDALYPLLGSEFAAEPGWQNPFGYANLETDDLLAKQRQTSGERRRRAVAELLRAVARSVPFVPVAFPDALSAVRETAFYGWDPDHPTSPVGLLGLERYEGTPATLRVATTDARATENRNPIAAEFRRAGSFLDLLYDPLARRYDGRIRPWLATGWEWTGGDPLTARLRLREDLTWHDGEPLDAADVDFTYRFLADTSLGRADSPIPTSRFRGRSTLVESVDVVDDRAVELRFADASAEVAVRAFTVPLLPAHVWSEYTGPASIAGIEVNDETTEALVWDNPEPVGSGPLRFAAAQPGERLRLERFDDHFLARDPDGVADRLRGGPSFAELRVEVAPSDVAAVEAVAEGFADATASNLGVDAVPRIGRANRARLVGTRSSGFYHVGFNARSAPLSNPRFRRAVARLIDKGWLVDDVFDGYAAPAPTPLSDRTWVPVDLQWDGEDPATPFLGENGEVDAEAARERFREAGFRYDSDGRLLSGDSS